LPLKDWLIALLDWVDSLGAAGPVVLGIVYVVATVLFVPGLFLSMGAGALFGVVTGTITVSIASTLGATAAFIVGRYFARDAIAKKIEGNAKFSAVDRAVGNEGWKIVGLVRLSPLFPFNLINYAFGLTNVKLRDYFFASWIGMFPGTVMYVYIGSLFGDLAELAAGTQERSPMEWALVVVGLAATVVVTVFVTRIARRALNEAIEEG
jgi:uncharacterized membrane protein YdjX (TVP38/TMEM64 family)